MKHYKITVNGQTYDVDVEESLQGTNAAAPIPAQAPRSRFTLD